MIPPAVNTQQVHPQRGLKRSCNVSPPWEKCQQPLVSPWFQSGARRIWPIAGDESPRLHADARRPSCEGRRTRVLGSSWLWLAWSLLLTHTKWLVITQNHGVMDPFYRVMETPGIFCFYWSFPYACVSQGRQFWWETERKPKGFHGAAGLGSRGPVRLGLFLCSVSLNGSKSLKADRLGLVVRCSIKYNSMPRACFVARVSIPATHNRTHTNSASVLANSMKPCCPNNAMPQRLQT